MRSLQSSGMARWVSMEISRFHGICANTRFYYPNDFIDKTLKNMLTGRTSVLEDVSSFDPKIMTWKIMKLLPDCIDRPGFEMLNNYLGSDGKDYNQALKTYQLAERIAYTFDQLRCDLFISGILRL